MKVVVTGASGMIGTALLRRLQKHPELKIFALSRDNYTHQHTENNVSWIHGDLQSRQVSLDLVSGSDIIFHLAHPLIPPTAATDWTTATLESMRVSLNLFAALLHAGHCPKLVFVSSGGCVYGGTPLRGGSLESDLCQPTSVYGIEKLTIEHHIRLLAERRLVRGHIFRVANAYGKLLPESRNQGLIGTAINQAINRNPIRIFGSLDNVRDYVHVEDVCEALLCSLDYEAEFDVFNIGTGTGTTVRGVLQNIEDCLGRPLRLIQTPLPSGQSLPAYSVLNIEKANKILNWRPKIEILNGIKLMIDSAYPK